MSLLSQSELALNIDFQRRVQQAIATAAVAISAENPVTNNHANRTALAKAVLNAPQAFATPFAVGVATNPTISSAFDVNQDQGDIPDEDIQFTVNSVWDAYAGVA